MTIIGERTKRTDAETKVRGEAVYGADLLEQGTLHAKLLRSPVPAGRIVRLDSAAAEAMEGVVGVYTAADTGGHRAGQVIRDQAMFASDMVRFEGEPIGAVVAQTARQATRAMRAIELEIEEWEAVGDIEAALADGARDVHPDWESYAPTGPDDHPRYGNVAGEMISDPDPEAVTAAFAAAHVVVEDEYRAVRQYQAYMEPKNCLARFEGGRYTIHTGSQYPFNVRDRVAQYLDIKPSQVRVIGHHIGGGFGAKLDAGPEPYAALLARLTRRPVKLVYDRVEDLLTCPSRENGIVRIKTALAPDGEVLGRDVEVLMDNGAYSGEMPWLTAVPMHVFGQVYGFGATRVVAKLAYTNTAPTGAFRGVGGTYLYFALERHNDQCAKALGMDRREFRLRNLHGDGAKTLVGQTLPDAGLLGEAFAAADQAAPWDELVSKPRTTAAGKLRGVGIGAVTWLTNPMPAAATVKLNEDGTVGLITAATENGSGAVAMGVTQIAAAELGVGIDDVVVLMPDTDAAGFDAGSQGSRTTRLVGRAVQDAAAEVRDKVFDIAAGLLEASKDDLVLEDGQVSVRGVPESGIPLGNIAMAATYSVGPIQGTGRYMTPFPEFNPACAQGLLFPVFPTPSYHVHLAEVEVDPETGLVEVTRYLVVQEVGKAINPDGVRGQIQGAVAQGLGYALYETMDIVGGRYQQRSLETLRLPLASDIPDVEIVLLENPDADGPYGARGVAEPPVVPVAAVVGNAISDAIGADLNEVPFRPDDILEALASTEN
jgi:CO/xanthine dehydrogenase Mo-binding subunit